MNGCDYKEMIEGFEDMKKERLSTYEVKKA